MKKKIALVLSVIAISSVGGGVYAHAETTPVAYVSVDINPSVELGVNTFNQVISAEAYNEDGEKVLEGTKLINVKIDDAVNNVISNAISQGYIKEDGSSGIEITTSTDKEKVGDELEEFLKDAADKALDSNDVKAGVETENVALARRDEARKLGLTPGELNLIQKLQELDSTINIEDYSGSSIKDIQKKAKELRKTDENKKSVDNETVDNAINTSEETSNEAGADTNTDIVIKENTNDSTINASEKKEEKSNSNNQKSDVPGSSNQKDSVGKAEKQNNSSNSNAQSNSVNKDKAKNN